MKKFTKTLSIVLLVAMCMSMFAISSFAVGTHNAACTLLGKEDAVYQTCTSDGHPEFYLCSCGSWFLDEARTQYVGNKADYTIPAGHFYTDVAAVAATCVAEGKLAHLKCENCGKLFMGGVEVTAADVTVPVSTEHTWGEYEVVKAPQVGVEGEKRATCTVIGCTAISDPVAIPALEPAPVAFTVVQTNGGGSYTFSGSSDYYSYKANKMVDRVTANGTDIVFSATTANEIFIRGSQVADINKSQISLVFYSGSEAVSGLFISKPDKLKVDELVVNGLNVNKYIRESGTNVSFQTSDANPENVKIYNLSTQTDIPATGNVFTSAYYDTYTYTFSNYFLDSLDCGSYQIRCYYGASNAEYKTPGTLTISDAGTTVDNTLYYTNSTQGDSSTFKYVSGDSVPRLYSPLFLINNATLQISSNGGKSWSNVSVFNYYIEQSNNKSTSYAWIKDTFLDSLNADNIYYFRVSVPASAVGSMSDAVSNVVSLTTGPTLKAVDTAKHVINSTKNLRFVSSEKIAKVYVGNIQLTDANDFAVSNDGKTVTLSPDFLNKRTAGNTYTIKVLTTSGEYASTTFQVLTTAQASASPRTGDTSNIGLWAAFLLISGGAVVAVLPRLKKEN